MSAIRLLDHFAELVDKRVFQGVMYDSQTTCRAVWLDGPGLSAEDLADEQYEIMGLSRERSSGAAFGHFGPVAGSKAVDGFDIESDGPPGPGQSYTFTGWVLRVPTFS